MALFEQNTPDVAIVLFDVSGSTSNPWQQPNKEKIWVYDELANRLQEFPHKRFRFIFWSSPDRFVGRMRNGVLVLEAALPKKDIKSALALGRTVVGGGTCSYLGFNAIPPAWLQEVDAKGLAPMVIFLTDGQMGCSDVPDTKVQQELANAIRSLKVQLTIVAVENTTRDQSNPEAVRNGAGGDVYRVIQSNGLTGKVSCFVSHALNGSCVQIEKTVAPPGCAGFGDRFFQKSRTQEFMAYLQAEIEKSPDETTQMALAQKLAHTLTALTKDKPARVSQEMLRTFASMFTALNFDMVRWVLSDGMEAEQKGTARVLADVRAKAKNLFGQANEALSKDVCDAICLHQGSFVSPVCQGRVLTGSFRLVDKPVTIHKMTFPRAGVTPYLPVFPQLLSDRALPSLADQALRQWVRQIYARLYGVHPTSDEIIFLVLGTLVQVVRSPSLSANVKTAYRRLVLCMLRKGRLNSTQTEYERLLSGEPPEPNSGKLSEFLGFMTRVNAKMNLGMTEPWSLWEAMCSAVGRELHQAQLPHIRQSGASEEKKEQLSSVVEDCVPDTCIFDYNCLITLSDLTATGGWRLVPHGPCSPIYLFSDMGKEQLLAGTRACPICFANLAEGSFELVQPKQEFAVPEHYRSFERVFSSSPPAEKEVVVREEVVQGPEEKEGVQGPEEQKSKMGKLIILKGTVGAGKSTMAQAIKNKVEGRGGVCLIASVDKLTKSGMQTVQAVACVQDALKEGIAKASVPDLVVVVDTCGEKSNGAKIFSIDFSGWTRVEIWPNLDRKDLVGYFAWSLRNVLSRGVPMDADTFALSPATTSVELCINVHKTKANSLFGKEFKKHWTFAGATLESLQAKAEQYQANLPVFDLSKV